MKWKLIILKGEIISKYGYKMKIMQGHKTVKIKVNAEKEFVDHKNT